jgi:hypothetical protein
MAIVEATIAADLLTLYNAAKAGMSESDFADGMATIIADAIKSATVNTTVTVTSVSGVTVGPGVSGPGAGTGTGTLS